MRSILLLNFFEAESPERERVKDTKALTSKYILKCIYRESDDVERNNVEVYMESVERRYSCSTHYLQRIKLDRETRGGVHLSYSNEDCFAY